MEYQKFIPEGWYDTKDDFTLEELHDVKKQNKIIQGYAYKCDNDFNVHIKFGNNLNGIIPRNEMDIIGMDPLGNIKTGICINKINSYIQCKVKKIENDEIILSRKDVCEEAYKWAMNDLKSGDVIDGIVKNIRPYGVFVEIGGGVVGMIHIQDISVSRMKNPNERFSIGQKIKVMIKSVNRESQKVILTYKELLR